MTEQASSHVQGDSADYWQLFRQSGGIFDECRSAVADGKLVERRPEILAKLPLISRYDRGDGARIEGAARAVVDLAAYAMNRGTMTSLSNAASSLSASTVSAADPAAALQWLRARGIDRDEAMRLPLALGTDMGAMLALWANALRKESPDLREKDTATVPVVLSIGQGGVVGTIRVARITDGPPGLYPDPTMMAITACDKDFCNAIRNAWEARKIPGQTILWSIDAGINDAFQGNSAGTAFALALDELNRRMGRLGRVRYRRTNDSYVISAALDGTSGKLRGVNGLPEKFEEAAKAGKQHVVLAEHDRSEGETQARQWSLKADYAKDLEAAIAITRRLNPMFVVTLAATVFTLLVVGTGGTYAAYKIAGADHQTNVGKLLSAVSNLERLDQQTGTSTLPDMQAKAQYLLTAHALALDADRPDLANQIAESNVRSDPGIEHTLNTDLGGIQGMYTVGQYTVVTSDKGKIALIDSSTLDLLGSYTLPPGMETLNQPMVKALAVAPHAYNFATVSQVPIGVAGVSQRATLEIFSAGSKLRLVGQSSRFTRDQVRELSYSPGGDKLIAVTATRAYFWDVSNTNPNSSAAARCRARPGRSRSPSSPTRKARTRSSCKATAASCLCRPGASTELAEHAERLRSRHPGPANSPLWTSQS